MDAARSDLSQQIARLGRVRDVLSAVNSAMVRVEAADAICREACRIATTVGGLPFATVITVDDATGTGHVQALAGDFPRILLETALAGALADPDGAPGIVAAGLRSRRPVVANDLDDTDISVLERDRLRAMGIRALAAFPFVIDGSQRGCLVLASYERDCFSADEIDLITALANNLSFALELAAKRERLEFLSNYDPLTGLANRMLAVDRLTQHIAAAERRDNGLALLVVALDKLGAINTTLGDWAGDMVLRTVAQRLSATLGAARVARVSGDRFAIFVPELHTIRDVTELLSADGLALLAEPVAVGDRELRITAHVGCAIYPEDGSTAEALFRNAGAALQSAKASDRAYRLYAPELNVRLSKRLDLEARLHRALAEGQFVLHYQPQVDAASRSIVGVEALMRWHDPQSSGAPVPPAEFIPALHEIGRMKEVGRWALHEAARQHHRWLADGLAAPRIAVNVSPIQLADNRFFEDVVDAMRPYPGERGIELEVTETLFMSNVRNAVDTLRRIRELGVDIALDDFGTGYSSLSYLFELPISTIKIDRGFIDGMTSDRTKATIVSTMISLGRELKFRVIAEGVETEEQAHVLELLRCDQLQGYLTGRPMPADDVARLFARRAG